MIFWIQKTTENHQKIDQNRQKIDRNRVGEGMEGQIGGKSGPVYENLLDPVRRDVKAILRILGKISQKSEILAEKSEKSGKSKFLGDFE